MLYFQAFRELLGHQKHHKHAGHRISAPAAHCMDGKVDTHSAQIHYAKRLCVNCYLDSMMLSTVRPICLVAVGIRRS